MASNTFGLELSFHTVQNDLMKKEDVLIVIAHWCLTKFGFRCIGLGDGTTLSGNESESELLPSGWNGSETYSLRYLFDKKLFIMRGVRTDDILIINLLCTDLNVSNVTINVSETVKDMKGAVEKMVPTFVSLCERIRKELIEPVTQKISAEASTQTAHAEPRPSSPPLERSPLAINPGAAQPSLPDHFDPFNYGRSDLDPLGIGGRAGGMLFDPFRGRHAPPTGGFPRGRVPGARFDPIGPPGIGRPGRGFGPDPDHLPPPGYDDMFM